MRKRTAFVLIAVSVMTLLAGQAVFNATTYHRGMAPPSVRSEPRQSPKYFRATETVRSADGKELIGQWACDGPTTFEWRFGSDETVHLLEGRVEVNYRGERFVLNPGDTATFHAGTRATWHVPAYARKVFVLQEPSRLVHWWRRFTGQIEPAAAV
jgi:uncharacterized protein